MDTIIIYKVISRLLFRLNDKVVKYSTIEFARPIPVETTKGSSFNDREYNKRHASPDMFMATNIKLTLSADFFT